MALVSFKLNCIIDLLYYAEPAYQSQQGTLYYPSDPQDSRQSMMYSSYAPNLSIPLIQNYHPELAQQPQPQPQVLTAQQVSISLFLVLSFSFVNYGIHRFVRFPSQVSQQQVLQAQVQTNQQQSQSSTPTSQSSSQSHDTKNKSMQR